MISWRLTDQELAQALFEALGAGDEDAYMGPLEEGEERTTIDGRFNLLLVARQLRRAVLGCEDK